MEFQNLAKLPKKQRDKIERDTLNRMIKAGR